MKFESFILGCIGYSFKSINTIVETAPLDFNIENKTNILYKDLRHDKKIIIYNVLTILYNIIIFSCISWRVIYSLVNFFITYDVIHIWKILFQIIISIQYILGIFYYDNYEDCRRIKSQMAFKLVAIIAFVMCILYAILNVIFINYNVSINIYTDIYNKHGNVFLIILLFLDIFYGYLSFLINAIIFTICMVYHRQEMNKINLEVTKFSEETIDPIIKIRQLIKDINSVKHNYGVSVDKLNPFFIILNIFGSVYLYYFVLNIQDAYLLVDCVVDVGLFVLIDIIFFISIKYIKEALSHISETIGSQIYTGNFTYGDIERKHSSLELTDSIRQINYHDSNYLTTDIISMWFVLLKIVDTNWKQFDIFGFEMDDMSILRKVFGLIIAFLLSDQLIKFIQA